VLICIYKEQVLLVRRTGKALMSGLYEFPYIEQITDVPLQELGITALQELDRVSHSFTSFQAHLYPTIFKATQPFTYPDGIWIPLTELSLYPFSSGHRRVMLLVQRTLPQLEILVKDAIHIKP